MRRPALRSSLRSAPLGDIAPETARRSGSDPTADGCWWRKPLGHARRNLARAPESLHRGALRGHASPQGYQRPGGVALDAVARASTLPIRARRRVAQACRQRSHFVRSRAAARMPQRLRGTSPVARGNERESSTLSDSSDRAKASSDSAQRIRHIAGRRTASAPSHGSRVVTLARAPNPSGLARVRRQTH